MANDAPIGVVDSGVGGFSVLRELINIMPNENYVYIGDSARCPFGSRSPAELRKIGSEMVDFLLMKGCKAVVLACGTLSVNAKRFLEEHYPQLKIVGMNKGAKTALLFTRNKRVGVMATQATIAGGAHAREIERLDSTVSVFPQACPKWADLIEAGLSDSAEFAEVAKLHCQPLIKAGTDTIILACTHYPLVKERLRKIFGEQTLLIDPATETAKDARRIFSLRKMLSNRSGYGTIEIYFTGGIEPAKTLAHKFLDADFVIEQISIT
ncbi:MAG: glutamate racemase [Negativicutes bacterium]|jgi:glutamate racemase